MHWLLALSILANVALVVGILTVFGRERDRWYVERQTLLNRIQAPRQAVTQLLYGEESDEPPYISMENDKALNEYLRARGG